MIPIDLLVHGISHESTLRITTRVPAPGLCPSAVTLRPVMARAKHGPRQDSGFGNAGTLSESGLDFLLMLARPKSAEERDRPLGVLETRPPAPRPRNAIIESKTRRSPP